MRQRLALVAVLVVGLAAGVALGLSGQALAFPHTCSGTTCHGSDTDSLGDVCTPGTSTYWEDSYLPANAIKPHLTSFQVTPNPPCTGANVSEPKADPWPAPKLDPDGKPAQPKPGEATFRVTWTVYVPPGSKSLGSMNVAWSIAWAQSASGSGGSTTRTTTTTSSGDHYDLAVEVDAPATIPNKVPSHFVVPVVVENNGPDGSPAKPASELGLRVRASIALANYSVPVGAPPDGCTRLPASPQTIDCAIRALAAHGTETWHFAFTWTSRGRAGLAHAKRYAPSGGIQVYASIECVKPDAPCANNAAKDEVVPR